jgi:glycosyltransferase involved in cell wall biosynthesis
MINILHTESSMNLGGQELRILAEMEGLAAYGYRSILAARPGSSILKEAASRGLETYEVSMRGSIDPVAVSRFISIIRREKVDIINAHGSKDGWSAGIAARLTGCKVVRSRHIANPIRGHFFGRLVYGPLCDRVMTTSESIKSGMIERGVDHRKITSIPTGVDLDVFRPDIECGTFREEVGISGDVRLVGFVSVVRGDKGPDVFVKAAERILKDTAGVEFVIAGDGWMLPTIKKTVEESGLGDRIRIVGYRRDVPNVMTDIDVFVLPVKIPEGVPQAVLQAHATRTPVVASDMGGVNEVAIHDNTALIVKPNDPGALAESILRLLNDKALANRLSDAGYELVMQNYTRDRMLKRMDEMYRGLVSK